MYATQPRTGPKTKKMAMRPSIPARSATFCTSADCINSCAASARSAKNKVAAIPMAAVCDTTHAPAEAVKNPSVIISLIFPHDRPRHRPFASRATPPMERPSPERYPDLHPTHDRLDSSHPSRARPTSSSVVPSPRTHPSISNPSFSRARAHLSSSQRVLDALFRGHRDLRARGSREPSRRDPASTSLGDSRRRRHRHRTASVRHHHHDSVCALGEGGRERECDARASGDLPFDRPDREATRKDRGSAIRACGSLFESMMAFIGRGLWVDTGDSASSVWAKARNV